MSAAARRSLRRFAMGLVATLAVVLVAAPSASAPLESGAAGAARHVGPAGPDGIDAQHNETLVRDAS